MGFLVASSVPWGNRKSNVTEDARADEQRKPPASLPGKPRDKSVAG
jgi:hypothetical protein